jgi:hypothetical protein
MTARALTAENSRRLLDATHPLIGITCRIGCVGAVALVALTVPFGPTKTA